MPSPQFRSSANVVKADDRSVTVEMKPEGELPRTVVLLNAESKEQVATYTIDEASDYDWGGIR
ncbi:hypothetical protein LZ318_09835 [Saccharopolyspora indica]|uniref:hypothetical protein n=1 Tax=Saccharopolyspora indica TaxID=1229659 RepID=UPI0022EACD55|nr:hypothetical protein [Saccharopolyspora indica]MDA3643343.1 hypothetical protein [Saccharopolyspora indica]